MGWELRRSRLYLYRNEWVDGRRVKVYLAKADTPAAVLLEHGLTKWNERRAEQRRASAELRSRVSDLLDLVASADVELRLAAEGVLAAVGFHRHKRGELRMKRTANKAMGANPTNATAATVDTPMVPFEGTPPSAPVPLIEFSPLKDWIDNADDLFACARAGDSEAQSFLRRELAESERARRHFGDLGMRSTKTLIARTAGGDAVWAIGIEEYVHVMMKELLGPSPSILDRLIVRRIVNAWVAVHSLELELAIRPPSRPRDRAYLEAAAERASRRMVQAVSELARVRKLQLPNVLVSITPPSSLSPPSPRMGVAEILETANTTAGPSDAPESDKKKSAAGKSKRGKSGESSPRRGSRGRSQQNGDSR